MNLGLGVALASSSSSAIVRPGKNEEADGIGMGEMSMGKKLRLFEALDVGLPGEEGVSKWSADGEGTGGKSLSASDDGFREIDGRSESEACGPKESNAPVVEMRTLI